MKDNKSFGIKIVLSLLLLMFLTFSISIWGQETEQKFIKKQLEALRYNQFTEAYYAFTSKEFQTATSLTNFKKFINNFPLFTTFSSIVFNESKQPEEIRLTLKNDHEVMDLIYSLSKVDKSWRVRKIEVAPQEYLLKDVPEFDSTLFLTPVKQHIEALHMGNLQRAYKETTAEAFQSSTPFSEFETFIKSFPIFNSYEKVDYYKLSFNNNLGMYQVKLIGKEGESYELQYDLIKENGRWKILQIQISDTPT